MVLTAALTQLDTDFTTLTTHLRDFATKKPTINSASNFSILDECVLEGLLSRGWQSWCKFCRTCVVESSIGTTNSTGVPVAALPQATNEFVVSGAAIRAKSKPNPPFWGAPNTTLRLEPTWGDVNVLAKILPRLSPNNATQLLSAFSAGSPSAMAMQLIRNGAAHDNSETRAEVLKLQAAYIVFPISHPTHALFWTEPSTGDFLITHALQHLRNVALAAIS